MADVDVSSNRLNGIRVIQRSGNAKDQISDAKHLAFKNITNMRTNLIRLGYTSTQVDKMNKNDMIFALRERWAEPTT